MTNTIIIKKLERPLYFDFYKNNSFKSSLRIEPRLIKATNNYFRSKREHHVGVRITDGE